MMATLVAALLSVAPDAGVSHAPRLGVMLVVDQLGSADLETPAMAAGSDFGGLETRGVRFDAWYDNLSTETAPGHATLSTGASPSVHGICANQWFTEGKSVYCVDDSAAEVLGAKPGPGRSAQFLEAPTLGDTLKTRSPHSKVISISVKDRAAILMGGASADLALWYEPSLGRYTTSTAWAARLPTWASRLADLPQRAFKNGEWSMLDGGSATAVNDARPGEGSPEGFGPTFPHHLATLPEAKKGKAYRLTPNSVADVFSLAIAAVDEEELGRREAPDLLLISLSATDYAGHAWGPGSAEKIDLLERASLDIRQFTRSLDERLGATGWVMVVSGDHGAAPLPEQSGAMKVRSGRVKAEVLLAAVKAGLPPDQVRRVLGVNAPHLFLDERGLTPESSRTLYTEVRKRLAAVPGVRFPRDDDALVVRSTFGARCGGVVFDLAPGFVFTSEGFNTGTDHSSGNVYDRRVPLFVVGPHVVAGRDFTPVDARDAAPTLAALLGIAPPDRSEGKPLLRPRVGPGAMSEHERLAALVALASQAEATDIANEARTLLQRVEEGRFFVACLGQFKRGKSTLINALVGESLLPSGVAPVTSVVTVIRFGARRARVRIGAGDWREVPVDDLQNYVAEDANPENRKGVTGVEVFCPSRFLETGLCLVDTPGLSSVFAGNTAETQAFVPQIDAAIVVLGGDPPISGDELALVASLAERVENLLFVINKADRLSADELKAAREFTMTVLTNRLSIPGPTVFEVSALERLRGAGPDREWPPFIARIEHLAGASGSALVSVAASRGLAALVGRLRWFLNEQLQALSRPVEESARRVEMLRKCAGDAQFAAVELRPLFDAEQQTLAARFEEQRAGFLERTLVSISAQLDARLRSGPPARGPALRRHALSVAQDLVQPEVRRWLDEQRPLVEREFAAVTERMVRHANQFLERLRTDGRLPEETLASPLVAETGLRARSRFSLALLMRHTSSPLWLWLADLFRPGRSMRVAARRAAIEFAHHLLEVNSNRVAGDFDERITESRRSVEAALRRTLASIVGTAQQAAIRASELHGQGAAAIAAEKLRLAELLEALGRIERVGLA